MLQGQGMNVGIATIVDANIISAPISTNNKVKKHDPEMCQVGKGKNYFFGMKLHIGVDSPWADPQGGGDVCERA
jgi:IS5 family transposase